MRQYEARGRYIPPQPPFPSPTTLLLHLLHLSLCTHCATRGSILRIQRPTSIWNKASVDTAGPWNAFGSWPPPRAVFWTVPLATTTVVAQELARDVACLVTAPRAWGGAWRRMRANDGLCQFRVLSGSRFSLLLRTRLTESSCVPRRRVERQESCSTRFRHRTARERCACRVVLRGGA